MTRWRHWRRPSRRRGRASCRVVLVTGAPGVGKTALVNELRPAVTGRDGWFVAGKFDQYRRDLEFDGVYQVFRALGRLLLAEPEDELAEVRERILEALGPNAGLTTAVVPEFAALLPVPPDPGDPLTAQVRAQRNAVELLRAIASPERPVVVFVDDLQWAGRTPLGLFDLALSEEPIEGLLLVGAYREGDVDVAHPLAALLSRADDEASVEHMRLANLPVAEPRHHGRRDAARGPRRRDEPGRGDPAPCVRQPVRDRRVAECPAPRRADDGHGRGVAVGRRSDPPSSGPNRGRGVTCSEYRRPAGGVARDGRGDGVPRRSDRAERPTDRQRRARRRRGGTAGARPRRRPSGGASPGRIRRCASATTASTRRS